MNHIRFAINTEVDTKDNTDVTIEQIKQALVVAKMENYSFTIKELGKEVNMGLEEKPLHDLASFRKRKACWEALRQSELHMEPPQTSEVDFNSLVKETSSYLLGMISGTVEATVVNYLLKVIPDDIVLRNLPTVTELKRITVDICKHEDEVSSDYTVFPLFKIHDDANYQFVIIVDIYYE